MNEMSNVDSQGIAHDVTKCDSYPVFLLDAYILLCCFYHHALLVPCHSWAMCPALAISWVLGHASKSQCGHLFFLEVVKVDEKVCVFIQCFYFAISWIEKFDTEHSRLHISFC